MELKLPNRSALARADSLIVPECVYRPGSFSGLMALYESNFLKFEALVAGLDSSESKWISRVSGDNDLHLERISVEPYTSTYRMTYWLRDVDGSEIKDPDLTVRVYRDAAQAEAMTCQYRHRHELLRDLAVTHARELSRRWQINMMLNKWLDFLLDRGHGPA